jgi:hypothetical protein
MPRFRNMSPANEHASEMRGRQLELWIVSDDNGFQILRFTDTFKTLHKDLFED